MADFLTDQWVDELAAAAAQIAVDRSVTLSLRQVVERDGGEATWTIRVGDGRVTVDRDPQADVSLTTDQATAAALVQGELSPQDALTAGRLRLGGNILALLAAAPALAGLTDAFAAVRASTTFPAG